MGILSSFNRELAIDLGTSNSIVIYNDQIVADEPTVLLWNKKTEAGICFGQAALSVDGLENYPDLECILPLMGGSIADFEAASLFIGGMMAITKPKWSLGQPVKRVVVCIPIGLCNVEERAVREAFEQCGVKEIRMIHAPIAAALGMGIDVFQPVGRMIVDIGGGKTDVAVVSNGEIVLSSSICIAGRVFDEDIVKYMLNQHGMKIGMQMAEKIKMAVGAASDEIGVELDDFKVLGKDAATQSPKEMMIGYKEVAHALDTSIGKIERTILQTLEETPSDLKRDIRNKGIYLTGGGALLREMVSRLSASTGLQVHFAEDPLRTIARGTAVALKNFDTYPFLTTIR